MRRSALDVLEFLGKGHRRVLVFKVLLVGLGVGHGGLAHAARVLQPGRRRLGVVVLVVACLLLQLGGLLGGLGLGLLGLEAAGHPAGCRGVEGEEVGLEVEVGL